MTTLDAPPLPTETVTTAAFDLVDLPAGAGRVALVRLDNGDPPGPAMRPTTFGPQSLANLDQTLDALSTMAAAGEIAAVALTGKAMMFATGADLAMVPTVTAYEQALETIRQGQTVFRRLADLGVPTFAFINGLAIGGGLELALHCTYRTVSESAPALGLPECALGLVPGWGGTRLLPHLIGPEGAVRVIVTDALEDRRLLDPRTAHQLGVVDALLPAADFVGASLDWAAGVLQGRTAVPRPAPAPTTTWEAAIAHGHEFVGARAGATAAANRALDLIALAGTAPADEAFAAAAETTAELLMTDEFRASLYAVGLVRAATAPALGGGLPTPIRRVGVLGSGDAAARLAALCARRLQVPVVICGADRAAADRALRQAGELVSAHVGADRAGTSSAARQRALLSSGDDVHALAGADVVLECVQDRAAVPGLLAAAEEALGDTGVLVSTTGTVRVADLARGLRRPQRLLAIRLVPPMDTSGLVEVVAGDETDDAAEAAVRTLARRLGKVPVRIGDGAGGVVVRLLTRLVTASLAAAGGAVRADAALAPLGLPARVGVLADLVGVDLPAEVADAPAPSTDEVRHRVAVALAEEVHAMLAEGVVRTPTDVDRCLLLGAGWPTHLGGLTPYLDRVGASAQAHGAPFLPTGMASRPRSDADTTAAR
ncbi:enoyl-CoA hydratase/isomerase family protein [Micromonospora sp. STR1_7]|uniref:Enoyl-CoA hydratase/isomerase family protein n=1 Tax=Micromonospora parastrephiae TaxID=2806101 RepID=A0ABS1XWD6_9ACTN|nr:3-hydroxyacyl-CoA dehydrogenase NAD-binding domain-containing protein [Micromonospora parastrephiae]MBM0233575.1 enoyl-CoA hydratase/isomerase family protein [Micromonospora parastrephiae]